MDQFKLFTHTDLDGVGCAIVAHHLLFGDIDVTYCDYHNVDEKITDFIQNGNPEDYEAIFITDISVHAGTEQLIDESSANWQLIDHHKTALHLNEKDWAEVTVEEENGIASGTSLFYEFLGGGNRGDFGLEHFAETVRKYDSWEWQTKYETKLPKELNDLLYILGRERFVKRFKDEVLVVFDETEATLLKLEQEKIDSYVNKKAQKVVGQNVLDYEAGVVFAESNQSELGNRLAEKFPELDFIAMINPERSVSLRTKKDDVDVSEVAKHFGGGGHPKAAGFPIPVYADLSFIDEVFKERQAID